MAINPHAILRAIQNPPTAGVVALVHLITIYGVTVKRFLGQYVEQ